MTANGGIEVQINGDPRVIHGGATVSELLLELGLHPQTIVVERNGEILRRDVYAQVEVLPGDVLELVHFVGGGKSWRW